MTPLLAALAAAATLVLASPAHAAWTTPVTVDRSDEANPVAQAAFGGSVLIGSLEPTVALAKRAGETFAPPAPLTAADPFEKVWEAGLADNGAAIVITERKHLPVQRIRAIFVSADGARTGPVTISDHAHSAAQPELSVAPDGSAVAAWVWHDKPGWRVQAAVRRPGQPAFDKPQTLSPPGPKLGDAQQRPWIHVAAGEGGRAVLTWQIGGDFQLPESSLHVRTAGPDGVFGADQELGDAGGLADVALAVAPDGAVQVAYLDEHFAGHEAPSNLHVAQGTAGAPLAGPVTLAQGKQGTSSGPQVATVFSADGSATVAWAKPGRFNEEGGDLEVFTRPAGGSFGPAQLIARRAQGVVVAAGASGAAVLSWMREASGAQRNAWTVHAALRPAAGGPFAPEQVISDTSRNALWPSVAMTPAGDAVATWVTNTDGSGGGQVAAALSPAG
jgi:hypothetical protein